MDRRLDLEIAQLIGEPINIQLPVPVALAEIADTATAEPGDHVWRLQDLDENVDIVLNVDPNGVMTPVKRTPLVDVELTFSGLNSKLEYVLVEDVLNKIDTNALARRKASITRGMDKAELKIILDALLTPTTSVFPASQVGGFAVTIASGDDIYDVFMMAKHGIEDYGDNYSALCGSTVKERIDTYDKDQETTFHYNLNLVDRLNKVGITVRKIFGQVSRVTNEAQTPLLDPKKMILVARDSTIASGKPIEFVRRKISPDIAKSMGADVDTAQRALIVGLTPVNVDVSGTTQNVLGYSVFGYESIVMCVKNPKAIATADLTSILS